MGDLKYIIYCIFSIAGVVLTTDTDCYNEPATSYRGTRNETWSGRTCQRWDVQTPHAHNYDNMYYFPMEETLHDVHNYCRDTEAEGYFWCFTTDPDQRWEECNIPICTAGTTLPGISFSGTTTSHSNMTTDSSDTLYKTTSSSVDPNARNKTTLPPSETTVTQGANQMFSHFSIILVQSIYSLSLYV